MIGLQREWAKGSKRKPIVAGERTFALLGLAGCFAAMMADELESPAVFLGIVGILGVLATVSYFVGAWKGNIGLTTEVAILISILIGALCYWGYLTLAVAIGIATTTLLSLKLETDRFVRALTKEDISSALELAVISAIVLPVLPNKILFIEPFDVLVPFKIWLMVVFITGISFLGYIAIKFVGAERGIGITGFLGGLVSSTAVTLSFSERSKRETNLAKPLALAITIAWTVMFARVLVEVGVLNFDLFRIVWIPIVAAGMVGLAYCGFLFLSQRTTQSEDIDLANPFGLSVAIKFGLLYAVILLISRFAQLNLGDTGLYISSFISGIADVDAITLSVAELTKSGGLELNTGSRAIVIAAMSNTIVKGCIAIIGGSTTLRKALLPGIFLIVIVGVLVAFIT
jgi:uncharacterized membrane protein (DUF4010 family)